MRAADVCVVTSLHDGMNLVAKEFVAARDDEQGVLILSQFAGASRELPEALVVNPYDADQCAAALQIALTMPPKSSASGCASCAAWSASSTSIAGRAHAARCVRAAAARTLPPGR
jgi:trehalose-6-phosphate synthase